MKKTVRLMAAMAVLLTASGCTQEELMPDSGKGTGAVGVTTYVANGSRGLALNNAADLIASENGFDLFAYETETQNQFMGLPTDGIEFAYNGGWDYKEPGEVKFWRQVTAGNNVDFYAVSPANTSTPTIYYDAQYIDFKVADASADQKDLMYAKTLDVDPTNQTVIDNGVHLDFYHALSQIVFKARTVDEYLTANVSEVEIVNLHNEGQFTFAEAAYDDYTADVAPWTITSADPTASYTAEIAEPVTGIQADAMELTNSETALLLLPQTITGAVTADKTAAPEDGGTYVRVKCHVTYQGESDAAATDIYGAADAYADLFIPLNSEWKAGYKYIYTIVFSKDISDPVTINEDLYVGPWQDGGETEIAPEETEEEPADDIVTPLSQYFTARNIDGEYYIEIPHAVELGYMRDFINLDKRFYVSELQALAEGASIETFSRGGETMYFSEAKYIQTGNIDLIDQEWTPIGTNEIAFQGVYTVENDYAIDNLTISTGYFNSEFDIFVGALFYGLIEGGIIENIRLTNCNISNVDYAGGILYNTMDGMVRNCTVEGNIEAVNSAGGVCTNAHNSTVSGCTNRATIKGNNVAGISEYGGNIQNCYNYGEIISENMGAGIACSMYGSNTVSDCHNFGSVTGSNTIGGIVGGTSGCVITACHNEGPMNYTSIDISKSFGGIVGRISYDLNEETSIIGCYNVGGDDKCEASLIGCVVTCSAYQDYEGDYFKLNLIGCYNTAGADHAFIAEERSEYNDPSMFAQKVTLTYSGCFYSNATNHTATDETGNLIISAEPTYFDSDMYMWGEVARSITKKNAMSEMNDILSSYNVAYTPRDGADLYSADERHPLVHE